MPILFFGVIVVALFFLGPPIVTTKCIDGVSYHTSFTKMAVKYNVDGTIALCE